MTGNNRDLPDVNAEQGQPVSVDTQSMHWEASPSGTVWRKPLFRTGGEFGPVTSIVRYAAGGAFRAHSHPQGEEILVLDGVFADEHGEYPAGTWFFNPHGSSHSPRSDEGCDLFVRLRQYPGADRATRCVDTRTVPWSETDIPGVQEKRLYQEAGYPEDVRLFRLADGVHLPVADEGTMELLVLEGELESAQRRAGAGYWLREPAGSPAAWRACGDCVVYRRVAK